MMPFYVVLAIIGVLSMLIMLGEAIAKARCPRHLSKRGRVLDHDYINVSVKAFMSGHENGYVLRQECKYCGDVIETHFVTRLDLIWMGLTDSEITSALYDAKGYVFPQKSGTNK